MTVQNINQGPSKQEQPDSPVLNDIPDRPQSPIITDILQKTHDRTALPEQDPIVEFKQKALAKLRLETKKYGPAMFEFLEQHGIVDRLAQEVLSIQDFKEITSNRALANLDESLEKFLFPILQRAIPANFLAKHIEEIYAVKRRINGLPEEPDLRNGKNLFHSCPDKSLTKILRANRFKRTNETAGNGVGTGQFEEHIGANGLFVLYGEPYSTSNEHNILVFPASTMRTSGTICISNELSLSFLLENNKEPPSSAMAEFDLDVSRFNSLPIDLVYPDNRQELLFQYLLCMILKMLCTNIILQEEVLQKTDIGFTEISLPPENLSPPKMVIIKEEPEFFKEGLPAESPYKNIPFVTDRNLLRALIKLKGRKAIAGLNRPKAVAMFAACVDKGEIDLKEYAYV